MHFPFLFRVFLRRFLRRKARKGGFTQRLSNMFHRFHNLLPQHLNREITEIYATVAIKKFAFRLITVFEPIYVYLFFTGHNRWAITEGVPKVLLFYGAVAVLFGILSPFGAKIMSRFGLKKTLIASFPFAFLYYIFLLNINKVSGFFIAAILASALYKTLFWPVFHTEFARFSRRDERGREFSTYRALVSIASALGPLAGGFIISFYGFHVVFIVVLVLLAAGAVPLLLTPEVHQHYTDSYERAFLRFLHPKNWKQILSFVAKGGESGIQRIIWPLLLYTLAISFSSLGAITTASFALSLFASLWVGDLLDSKTGRRKVLKISSALLTFVHLSKGWIKGLWSAFVVDIFHKLTGSCGAHISYRTILYDKASQQEDRADEFIILREISHNIGRGAVFAGLALLFTFTSNLYLAFIVAAGLALLFPLIATHR